MKFWRQAQNTETMGSHVEHPLWRRKCFPAKEGDAWDLLLGLEALLPAQWKRLYTHGPCWIARRAARTFSANLLTFSPALDSLDWFCWDWVKEVTTVTVIFLWWGNVLKSNPPRLRVFFSSCRLNPLIARIQCALFFTSWMQQRTMLDTKGRETPQSFKLI